MSKEGFYKKIDSENLTGNNDQSIKIANYQLTEKGIAQSKPSPNGPLFCIGSYKVDIINWFTQPAVADGITVTKVS